MTTRSPDETVQCACCGRPFARRPALGQYREPRCAACRASCPRGSIGRVCHVVEGAQ